MPQKYYLQLITIPTWNTKQPNFCKIALEMTDAITKYAYFCNLN